MRVTFFIDPPIDPLLGLSQGLASGPAGKKSPIKVVAKPYQSPRP